MKFNLEIVKPLQKKKKKTINIVLLFLSPKNSHARWTWFIEKKNKVYIRKEEQNRFLTWIMEVETTFRKHPQPHSQLTSVENWMII